MTEQQRCKSCAHYTPNREHQWKGSCNLMGDENKHTNGLGLDRCLGWDYESYFAGVYVGPEFGCIHWEEP